MQEAVAMGLVGAKEHNFFPDQLRAYEERRDVLCSYIDELGLSYTRPEGTYFLLVDMDPVKVPESFEIPSFCVEGGRGKDFAKCWWLAQEIGVVAIPPSEVSATISVPDSELTRLQFYCKEHEQIGERFARFSFVSYTHSRLLFAPSYQADPCQCKDPELLHAAGKRLLRLKDFIDPTQVVPSKRKANGVNGVNGA
jgi:kynurenine aminotransferase